MGTQDQSNVSYKPEVGSQDQSNLSYKPEVGTQDQSNVSYKPEVGTSGDQKRYFSHYYRVPELPPLSYMYCERNEYSNTLIYIYQIYIYSNIHIL